MKNASELLAIGLIGGLIAITLHIPAGFMIGATVTVGISRLVFLNLGKAPRIYGEIGRTAGTTTYKAVPAPDQDGL